MRDGLFLLKPDFEDPKTHPRANKNPAAKAGFAKQSAEGASVDQSQTWMRRKRQPYPSQKRSRVQWHGGPST